jgi:hypothetical protein
LLLFFILRVISISSFIFTLIPSTPIVSYFTYRISFYLLYTLSLCQSVSSRCLSYFHFSLLVIFFCTRKQKVPFLCFASDQQGNPTTFLNAVQTTDPQYRLYNIVTPP